MEGFQEFLLQNVLPVLIPVVVVGFKMFHDLNGIGKNVESIGIKLDQISEKVIDLENNLIKNQEADKYRDKEISRLSRAFEHLEKTCRITHK